MIETHGEVLGPLVRSTKRGGLASPCLVVTSKSTFSLEKLKSANPEADLNSASTRPLARARLKVT
eukprot:3737376-Rhodomonas_salina.1